MNRTLYRTILLMLSTTSLLTAQTTSPSFVRTDNFWVDAAGNLNGIFPDPNSDGKPGEGTVYVILIRLACTQPGKEAIAQPGEEAVIAPQEGAYWPVRWTLPTAEVPAEDYHILVSRAPAEDTSALSPAEWISGPHEPETEPAEGNTAGFDRWLLHVPKLAGGFGATVKIVNRNPSEQASPSLYGFDNTGKLLASEQLTVPAGGVAYYEIYGQGGIFAENEDQISHIGIFEPTNLTDVYLRYISTATDYGAWTREQRIKREAAVGGHFEMEGRSSERYQDGVAILNLHNGNPAGVWVVQREPSTNAALAEVYLGELQPGEKLISEVSALFEYVPAVKYSFETRAAATTIQVMGLTFFGGEFFSPALVQRK